MSTKAQAVLEQISALPPEEQRDLWQELGRRIGQKSPVTPVELYGEPLTDDEIAESARVTFAMLDDEERHAQSR